jgi:hypothetical protein
MAEFRARIGRIKMKNGGAEVRILPATSPNPDGEDWRGKIIENARYIAEQATNDAPLVGYFILGMFGDGCTSTGFRFDPSFCNIIPRALMPSWIAEIARRDIVTSAEACDVVNRANGYND